MDAPQWLIPVLAIVVSGVAVFLAMLAHGPPVSGWCNRNRRHEWTHWECVSVGRVFGSTVNVRKCRLCGFTQTHVS